MSFALRRKTYLLSLPFHFLEIQVVLRTIMIRFFEQKNCRSMSQALKEKDVTNSDDWLLLYVLAGNQ